MKVKTSELTGHGLGWAVAVAEGLKPVFTSHWISPRGPNDPRRVCVVVTYVTPPFPHVYEPWRDWWQGGPILDREGVCLLDPASNQNRNGQWHANCGAWGADGATLLIAAMRCYVASKLGDEVEVPGELMA